MEGEAVIGLDMKIKSSFFDRAKVENAVNKAERKKLSKFGAFVRRNAQTRMRRAKGPSRPGEPPHAHVGLLRKLIFFAYEPREKSVVIGPVLLRSGSQVPSLHEFGGTTLLRNKSRDGKRRIGRYPARPFMGPAFEEELQNMPRDFKNSV
jgi:phage gpG-like protein